MTPLARPMRAPGPPLPTLPGVRLMAVGIRVRKPRPVLLPHQHAARDAWQVPSHETVVAGLAVEYSAASATLSAGRCERLRLAPSASRRPEEWQHDHSEHDAP